MGWWWTSSPQKDGSSPAAPAAAPTPQQQTPSHDALQSQSSPSAPPTLTRDEQQADAEFKQLLALFEGSTNETGGSKSINPSPSTSTSTSTSAAAPLSSSTEPTPSSSIAPDSLYEDTMSCRSAFDYAFFCQSFGGQFVNVYRYGELRSCSQHWDSFWLCMQTRTYPDNERKRLIRDHNRKKAIKYKTGPSSEDVWDMRTEPVRTAFQGDFFALEKEMKAEEEAGMGNSTV